MESKIEGKGEQKFVRNLVHKFVVFDPLDRHVFNKDGNNQMTKSQDIKDIIKNDLIPMSGQNLVAQISKEKR